MSSQKELVETALPVLVAWMHGRKPAPGDAAILRTAFPTLAHKRDDELAVQVIHDLCGRVFRQPGEERSDYQPFIDDIT